MLKGTVDVIRLALMHDIRRHQRALDSLSGANESTARAAEAHRNDMSDLRAALDDLETEERRVDAVAELVKLLCDWTVDGPQGHFTCLEADVFAAVMTAYGHSTAAAVFLEGHAEADADETEVDHYDRRLLTRSA
jgi:hypothetical protein